MSLLRPDGSTRAWRRLRAFILDRDGHVCRWCGGPASTADHVLPRARGGSDDPDNLVAACGPCNYSRGARMPRAPQSPPSRKW